MTSTHPASVPGNIPANIPGNIPANIDIAAALAEAEELCRARNPTSRAQYEEACAALPV